MIRPLFRLVLVLIAAAAIAVCAGGFSWDGPTNNVGWGASTPDTAIVAVSSVDSSGSATAVGFSWDDGSASSGAVAG